MIFSLILSISSKVVSESKLKDTIINNTILISNLSKGTINSVNDINGLIKDNKNLGSEEFNCRALNVFVKNKVVSLESINYLKENNKIDKSCKIKNQH